MVQGVTSVCVFHNKRDGFMYAHRIKWNRHKERRRRCDKVLLQKLSEVLADVLAAGPLTHTVAVQRVGASTFFM